MTGKVLVVACWLNLSLQVHCCLHRWLRWLRNSLHQSICFTRAIADAHRITLQNGAEEATLVSLLLRWHAGLLTNAGWGALIGCVAFFPPGPVLHSALCNQELE